MHPVLELFDSYGRQARLFPGLLTIFPPLLLVLAWFPELLISSVGASLLTLGTSCGLLYALSSFARTRGKAIETKLIKQWGGWPTTILLRHSSSLDTHTRKRYHAFLQSNVPGLKFPNPNEEIAEPSEADSIYSSSIKWLKEKTRDEKFALVERENAQYGFRRNLLGMKAIGIGGCSLSIAATLVAVLGARPDFLSMLQTTSIKSILNQLDTLDTIVLAGLLVNILAILAWMLVVREKWVREAGFQYADALLATCDKLKA